MVDGIEFHLVEDLLSIGQSFRNILENLGHLLGRLEPFLLGIVHSLGVGEFHLGRNAYQAIVGLGIVLVGEMHVVGGYNLDVVLFRHLHQNGVDFLLRGIDFIVCVFLECLVALQLKIIILAEYLLIP